MVNIHRYLGILLAFSSFTYVIQAQTPNLQFDGVDDHVTLPNTVLNNIGTGPFTVEAWIRGTEADQPTHPRILSNRDVTNNGFMLFFHDLWGGSAHKMLCLQLDGLNYLLIDNGSYNGSILDGNCHHVAISKGLDSLRFYVDGIRIGAKVLQGNPSVATNALNMLIGNDGPDPHPFNGNISQVRLWDHVRTQMEIAADLDHSIPGSSPGLLGYWQLNEGSGQSIADAVGNSPGALGLTPNVEDTDPAWRADGCPIETPIGGCMRFDGVDDHVSLPNAVLNDIGTGPFTVEAWVRGTEADQPAHPRILSNRDITNNGFMFFFHDLWGGSAHKMLCLQLDGLNYLLIDNGSYNGSILDGNCHHVAISKGLDSLRFYVDGIRVGSKVLQGNPSLATSALSMLIGNDGPDPHPFNGNISQVRLWDHVRTQMEVAADLDSSIPGSSPGLMGYWELNEGSGQSVIDKTNTTHGALGSDLTVEGSDPIWVDDCCELDPVHSGMDRPLSTQALQIHPNPARNMVQVELGELQGTVRIFITDITGRVVFHTSSVGQPRILLDVSHLPSSVYMLHLRAGTLDHSLRFVKE